MKKLNKGILAIGAAAIIGAAMFPALSKADSTATLTGGKQMQPAATMTVNQPRQQVRAAVPGQGGTIYWQTAKSIYDSRGDVNVDNGCTRNFGTRVVIDGTKATIYGLVNLYYMEVDKEYPVEGVYDNRAGTITITGTEFIPNQTLDKYIKLADIYDGVNETEYTLCLIAGDVNGRGDVTTENELVLKVSDDMKTVTSMTGYGAYAFNPDGSTAGFYDYYKSSSWNQAQETVSLGFSSESIAFSGQFVADNMPVKEQVNLFNAGSVDAEYTITTSSDELTVTPASGTVEGCSNKPLTVTLNATNPGMFEGYVRATSGSNSIEIPVKVNVQTKPDYTRIVNITSKPMTFSMSPVYPFVLGEYNGRTVAMATNKGAGDNTESWFTCNIDIPEGKTGVFSWNAVMQNKQPNTLYVLLDGEPIKYDMYRPNLNPFDMSGAVALTEGHHEVTFDQDITIDWVAKGYHEIADSYVWGLNLKYYDAQDDKAVIVSNGVDFGKTYYDNMPVKMTSEVTVLNLGRNPLSITGVETNGNFSGIVPTQTAPTGGEIAVPLVWTASAVGGDAAVVTIHTSGGDVSVNCRAEAVALPYDYSQLVKEGEFSFNTDMEWPFVISEAGKYAYNSTSKADIDGITWSWLEASFEVPEGKVGRISWDAYNDSEDLYVFMNKPSMISGTQFTIDGANEALAAGINTHCGSAEVYSKEKLMFSPGIHNVKFNYKKTGNEEKRVFGDDRLKLFELGLELLDLEDNEGTCSADKAEFVNDVFIGTAGHFPVTIYNHTSKTPELISSECDGPFEVRSMGVTDGNLNLMVEFNPESEGSYSNDLDIITNLGTYKVKCSGKAVKSDLGTAIFYESFEYGLSKDWAMEDKANQGQLWAPTSEWSTVWHEKGAVPYDGSNGLMVATDDPDTFTYYDNYNTYASTPAIAIPESGKTTLRFLCKSQGWSAQTLEILAGEGSDPADYKVIDSVVSTPADETPWTVVTVDLSEFAGKEIHLSFHVTADLSEFVVIDDVLVATTANLGISQIGNETNDAVEYYSTTGVRLAHPAKGINIVVVRKANGTTESHKVMIK